MSDPRDDQQAVHNTRSRVWQRCPTREMRAWRDDYLRDGLVIARRFLDESTLVSIQRDLEKVVDTYEERLLGSSDSHSTRRKLRKLDFHHRYTAMYEANLQSAHNKGERSDLPAYFRSEVHTMGVHKFLTHSRLHELIRCLLPHEAVEPPALKLYPVYMARGKVPDSMSRSAMTVDWHQDAGYTYYWYSGLNTTRAEIDDYASSVVNTWVPITDTPLELGPVQLIRRRPLSLTRADMLCDGDGCPSEEDQDAGTVLLWSNKSKKKRREYLRVHQIDEYVEEFPERVFTAEMSRGDVLFFDQFTYHRGLPNVSPNRTRWSVDFRFQDVRVPTLRSDPGFVLGSDKAAQDAAIAASAPLIATEEDWLDARPSLRLSELNGAERKAAAGGHEWASRHIHNSELRGALDLEQVRHLGSREKSRL